MKTREKTRRRGCQRVDASNARLARKARLGTEVRNNLCPSSLPFSIFPFPLPWVANQQNSASLNLRHSMELITKPCPGCALFVIASLDRVGCRLGGGRRISRASVTPSETLRLSILRGGTHKKSHHSKTKGLSTHLRGQRIKGTKDSRDC
jgi:hypothetical protein